MRSFARIKPIDFQMQSIVVREKPVFILSHDDMAAIA